MAATSALSRLSLINPHRTVALSALEVARQRESANPERLAASLQFYGDFLLTVGAIEQAEAALDECLTLWQQLDRPIAMVTGVAPTLRLLGIAAQQRGDHARALTFYEQASKIYQEAGSRYSIYMNQFLSASASIPQGNYQSAENDLRSCLRHFHAQGDGLLSSLILAQLAELARVQGLVRQNAILLGAAACFEREVKYVLHMGISGVLRRTFAQILAAANNCHTDPTFAEAWAAGQSMSLDEVVT
jgi:tetratricopeptide (TPR) repeat protein